MKPLRIVVVGCGHMGRRHAEKVAALEGSAVLAGVADVDLARARRGAARAGTRAVADARELFPDADAAIVAVPTLAHYQVVKDALEARLDVLVEKPIAAELAQAESLVSLARQSGCVLQVGHQEWFNPAVRAVRERVRGPRFVEAQRVGPFTDRATDVDVVRDLMIHDLDIVQQLLAAEPVRVDAVGVPVITGKVDVANARLVFPDGCVATLTASRVARRPARRIRLFERHASYSLDLLAQSAQLHRRSEAGPRGRRRLELEEVKAQSEDALLAQLRAFVRAVRTREPGTTDGLGALRTALRVIAAMPPLDPPR